MSCTEPEATAENTPRNSYMGDDKCWGQSELSSATTKHQQSIEFPQPSFDCQTNQLHAGEVHRKDGQPSAGDSFLVFDATPDKILVSLTFWPQMNQISTKYAEQRRRAQNRASQRAYRHRRDEYVKELEQELTNKKAEYDQLLRSYQLLREKITDDI